MPSDPSTSLLPSALSRTGLNADVVALQEVEDFERCFRQPLRQAGLDGVFKQRTGGQQDGVVLLWRVARLALRHVEPVEYAHALTRHATDAADEQTLRKHNVGLVGIFFDRFVQRELVIATTVT